MTRTTYKTITAVRARFQREKDSPWEMGLAVGTSDGGMVSGGDYSPSFIADLSGKPISEPWDYRLEAHYGCLILTSADV